MSNPINDTEEETTPEHNRGEEMKRDALGNPLPNVDQPDAGDDGSGDSAVDSDADVDSPEK